MKLALIGINAKYIHSNLALLNLRSYANEFQANIEIAEYTINNSIDHIVEEIYKLKADILCFSCYVWNIRQIDEVISELNKILPEGQIWLGGPEVSFFATEYLSKHKKVKGVMCGEGETIFLNLCKHYIENSIALQEISGIVYRDESGIVENKSESIMDMDSIPFGYDEYADFDTRYAHKIIYYESSRGCPFRCSYCLSSVDKKLRYKSLEKVFHELSFFIKHRVSQVKFVDRTFNCDKSRSMAIWTFLNENDNGITNFHFEIAADILSDEEVELLTTFRPGLIQLEIGVQTTNTCTLKEINRTADFTVISHRVRQIQRGKNIHQHLDLIAGLPYEDLESFHQSFNDVFSIRPEQLQLGFLKVLKGSSMHDYAEKYGLCYSDYPPYEVRKTNWLSYEDILLLKHIEEMVEVYYNSHQFETAIEFVLKQRKDGFLLFLWMGNYYEQEGLFLKSHNRMSRYELFYQMAVCMELGNIDELKEALLFDLYLREDIKSRPDFLPVHPHVWKGKKEKGMRYHYEWFHYDFTIEAPDGLRQKDECGFFVKFDYDQRDALSNRAKAERVD